MLELRHLRTSTMQRIGIKPLDIIIRKGESAHLEIQRCYQDRVVGLTIAGVLQPACGQVIISGKDMATIPQKAKSVLGYVPSQPAFLGANVYELLNQLADISGIPYSMNIHTKLLDSVGLLLYSKAILGDYALEDQQKVYLAAALLRNVDVLVLDEPLFDHREAIQNSSDIAVLSIVAVDHEDIGNGFPTGSVLEYRCIPDL